jgi:hypothetical protein
MDLDQLRQQRKRQNEQRRSAPTIGPASIGKKQNNGLFDVEFVDGSLFSGRGLKVFDAQHSEGDTVTAIPKQDGTIALEGPKAVPPDPDVFEDKCGNYLGGQIFTCPPKKKETLDVWGLGLLDAGSLRQLCLINLKTGVNYTLTSWPTKIQPCPIASPNDPPPPPTPPPEDPDEGGAFAHKWQSSSGWAVTPDCNGGIPDPPYGRIVYTLNSVSVLRTTIDLVTGLVWESRFWNADWFDDNDNFIQTVGGVYYSTTTGTPTPPAVPQGNPCWSIVSGPNAGNATWQLQTHSYNPATYVSASCPPTGPGSPRPPSLPRDPSKPPIDNSASYTLSLDAQRRPIVRVKHTPQCKLGGYEFDGYFRLESTTNGLQIKTYKGNSKMKDWRFDLPDFACKSALKSNPWISFEIGRVWAWQAEADKRPVNLLLNGPPVEAFITKSTIAQDCTVPTGGEQTRIKYNAVYKGSQGPSELEVVSIAAYKRAG